MRLQSALARLRRWLGPASRSLGLATLAAGLAREADAADQLPSRLSAPTATAAALAQGLMPSVLTTGIPALAIIAAVGVASLAAAVWFSPRSPPTPSAVDAAGHQLPVDAERWQIATAVLRVHAGPAETAAGQVRLLRTLKGPERGSPIIAISHDPSRERLPTGVSTLYLSEDGTPARLLGDRVETGFSHVVSSATPISASFADAAGGDILQAMAGWCPDLLEVRLDPVDLPATSIAFADMPVGQAVHFLVQLWGTTATEESGRLVIGAVAP